MIQSLLNTCKCILFLFLFICFPACETAMQYDLAILSDNKYNRLNLKVQNFENIQDYEALFDQFDQKDTSDLIDMLKTSSKELHFVSFFFYYLANAYAKHSENSAALKYHLIAAQQYLNPQSYLKLAEYNFFVTKDLIESYKSLRTSLELKVEFTQNNRSHPLAVFGKDKAQYLLDQFNLLNEAGAVKLDSLNQQLKLDLPEIMEQCRKMYDLEIMD